MNKRAAFKRIEFMVNESHLVERLTEGSERDPRGLKTNVEMIRLLLLGLLLSISELKSATISSAYIALTEVMEYRDQLRLGVVVGPGPEDFIKRDRLYHAADILEERLAYGKSVEGVFTRDERDRRHNVVLEACFGLLDYTAEATMVDDTELAIDQTAVWAWSRGKYCPKPTLEEIAAQSDELIREVLVALREGDEDTSDLDSITVTDDPEKLRGLDPDAAWSGATAKNGGLKRFFGYYASLIAAVPRGRIADDPTTRAPIVRRVEVTCSTDDVVDVSLRLLDSLPAQPAAILGDRHYSYKQFERWQRELIKRGTRQVLDLRSTDHKALRYEEATYVDGFAHCPAMPDEFLELQRPGVFARKEEHEAFQAVIESRWKYAHVAINQMDENGKAKLRCPAREFKVACPLFPPSMAVAAENGLTIVNTDLLDLEPGQALPRCCGQDSFRVTLPEAAAKLNQLDYWGSAAWYQAYDGRSYVEGVFGNLKNPRTENLRRGSIQKTGLVWAQLMMTLICATYNVRVIRSRHERMESDDIVHPLLTDDEETVAHISLTKEQERVLYEAFRRGENIEDLEIKVVGSRSGSSHATSHEAINPRHSRPSPTYIPSFFVTGSK